MSALLLDPPPLTAAEVVRLERSISELLVTGQDVVLVPAEATLALEAAAAGLGRPGGRALNIVTGPYGRLFGEWLSRAGCDVVEVAVGFDRGVLTGEVTQALAAGSFDLVCVVHAEAATGMVNGLQAISEAARRHGALVVVDAVASVGAERLELDAWGVDVCAVGAHKALAGPCGLSAVTVSSRAWDMFRSRSPAIRRSSLSLLDWKEAWIDSDRTAIPGYLPILETRALAAAVNRALGEGMVAVVQRHRRAAAASQAGAEELGLRPWVPIPGDRAAVATLVRAPDGITAAALVQAADAAHPSIVERAPSVLDTDAVRISHTGRQAALADVLIALIALAEGLSSLGSGKPGKLDSALRAARAGWHAQ